MSTKGRAAAAAEILSRHCDNFEPRRPDLMERIACGAVRFGAVFAWRHIDDATERNPVVDVSANSQTKEEEEMVVLI